MARKPRARYRFKGNFRFNDRSLEGIVVMHVKGDLYRVEELKELRAIGLKAQHRDLTIKADYRGMFLEGPL